MRSNRRSLHAPLTLALLAALLAAPLLAHGAPASDARTRSLAPDPHSFSRPDEVRITHLDLELDVDFEHRRLRGRAGLDLEHVVAGGAEELVLDTRGLTIESVRAGPGAADLHEASHVLGLAREHLGRPLSIDIDPDTERVVIDYVTSPEAAALMWLGPEQTAGGEHPFLFTQSQAILARTWVPCQDTPTVRMTYSAQVRVPEGLMAVMSAENPTGVDPDGVYELEMPQAIPSYLLALAVGDLEFRSLGPDTGVYAEPSVVEAAAYEFADTQAMLEAAEALYGPYRWGRYDLLVLPPSFPFGGMENPRLTFVTPTILAGDRSLVALVAHELAHSWSGNLVTNATWNDFWLNEGTTVYLERRIMEAIRGPDYAEMLAQLALQDLRQTVDRLMDENPADTKLHLQLLGRDPDEGMTDVAYEKGFYFLYAMEKAIGRQAWDDFLASYFEANAFESMDTGGFVRRLKSDLLARYPEAAKTLAPDRWIYGTGLPDDAPVIESERLADVEATLERWRAGTAPVDLETAGWSTHEWLHFLRRLPPDLSTDRMRALDQAFGFSETGNSEILFAWLMRAIENDYEPAYDELEEFLTRQGRRKFLAPLYEELAKTDEGLVRARAIYRTARPGYHSVSTNTVDEILDWESDGSG